MLPDAPPPDALCERCWSACLPGQRAARFGHITGTTLAGDIQWAYTYLHVYDREQGCVTTHAADPPNPPEHHPREDPPCPPVPPSRPR